MPVRNFTLTGTRRNPARCSVWMADSDLMGARTDRAGVGGTTVRLRESPVVLNDSDTAAYYAIIRTRLQTRLAQCGSPRTRRSRWATCGRRRGQSRLIWITLNSPRIEIANARARSCWARNSLATPPSNDTLPTVMRSATSPNDRIASTCTACENVPNGADSGGCRETLGLAEARSQLFTSIRGRPWASTSS